MRRVALSLGFFACLFVGCEGPETSTRIDPALAPQGDAFRPVAEVFVARCGSLDCHGSKYRNMRLYGFGSARLDPTHRPDAPDTTDEEVARDYDAIVALEPDVFRTVVSEGGAAPERLTFVRKSRGAEAHKGGQRIVPGDDADACIQSWLSGAVKTALCLEAP